MRGGARRRDAHLLRRRASAGDLEQGDGARTRLPPDVRRRLGDARHHRARRRGEDVRRRRGGHGFALSPLSPEAGRAGRPAGGRLLRLHEQDRPRLPQAPRLVARELPLPRDADPLQHLALPVRQAGRRLRAEAGEEGRGARARILRDRRGLVRSEGRLGLDARGLEGASGRLARRTSRGDRAGGEGVRHEVRPLDRGGGGRGQLGGI